jgi:hypothetical protein
MYFFPLLIGCVYLRPRSASQKFSILREMGRSDDTGTEEDPVTEDDDHIFPPRNRRQRRAVSCTELSSPNTTFESHGMTNGHSSNAIDDSHESEGRVMTFFF